MQSRPAPGFPVGVIVTGDDDLLALGEYEDIVIVAPRTFLDQIRG
ncbi:MAG TPA: hypothetical protein VIM81_11100 [Gammaproteobacteria bacterium]